MKRWLAITMLAMSASMAMAASDHGAAKPKHGGVVQHVNEVDLELVAQGENAIIYLFDHGKPKSAGGISGTMSVAGGGGNAEAEVSFAGANKLQANAVKLRSGAKVVVKLNNVGGKPATINFTVK